MRRAFGVAFAMSGIIFGVAAVFALQIGLDNDPGWGKSRLALLGVGIVFFVLGVASFWQPTLKRAADSIDRTLTDAVVKGTAWLRARRPIAKGLTTWERVRNAPLVAWLQASLSRKTRITFVVILVFSVLGVLFYSTAGTFTHVFTHPHAYYDRLAEAFLHGEVALLEKPDVTLTTLSDPYPFENRANANYLWDVSYYNGRFYLYWGPAPALLLAVIKYFTHKGIEDQALVISGLLGVAGCLTFLGYRFQRKFAPSGSLFFSILIGLSSSLNLYLLWLTGRPGIYEAAIISGQCFLMGGLAALWIGEHSRRFQWIGRSAAGLLFGLAVGSRTTLAVGVVWVSLWVLWRTIGFSKEPVKQKVRQASAFLIPLGVVASVLLWYNAVRFGDPFENGFRYQLSYSRISPEATWTFSPAYVIPNVYGYVLRQPVRSASFPFIHIPFLTEQDWPWFIRLPENYTYHESQAGLLAIFPLSLLAGVEAFRCAMRLLVLARTARRPLGVHLWERMRKVAADDECSWFLLLLGLVAGQAGVILLYYYSAIRFQVDYIPALALLSWLSFWRIDRNMWAHPRWRFLFRMGVLALALYSLGIGLMGGFGAGDGLFKEHNLMLFEKLQDVFQYVLAR